MNFPESISINGWCGQPMKGSLSVNAVRWGADPAAIDRTCRRNDKLKWVQRYAPELDLRNWEDERVGWGLVLPDNEHLPIKQRGTANDAPEPIQQLVAHRNNAPVFRYNPASEESQIGRYDGDGDYIPFDITGSVRGIGETCLPTYLLIYASPRDIPWNFQYRLNLDLFVGRLDLEGSPLENYVTALIDNWGNSYCDPPSRLIWAVNHGDPDITWLMKGSIAKAIRDKIQSDPDFANSLHEITDSEATVEELCKNLKSYCPALIISTSHGMTGPLENRNLMRKQLGLLVDDKHTLLYPDILLNDWQPDGAIWYAHACCSAGCDGEARYQDLVDEESDVGKVLNEVAALGPQSAPLPQALLGDEKPLRAFIGQVEPTFNWTLQADTGQVLTSAFCQALYDGMHHKKPMTVGMAFEGLYHNAASYYSRFVALQGKAAKENKDDMTGAIRAKLIAQDLESLVILGDPTVSVPAIR